MHSSRRFEAIIANWLGLIGKEVSKFIFLNALLPDTPHDLKLLIQGQPAHPQNNKKNKRMGNETLEVKDGRRDLLIS